MLVLLSGDEELNLRWLSGRRGDDTRFYACTEPHELLDAVERQEVQHVVLSDRYFNLDTFGEFVEKLKERRPQAQIAVLLSDHHNRQLNERWMKTCLSNGYFWISPHRTREMIVQQLLEYMIGIPPVLKLGGSKLLMFIGSTPNIGTTLVSFGLAVQLARLTMHRVGYICLNLKSSKLHRYLGRERPAATLDHLRAELRSQSLTRERLLQSCESVPEVPQLHVLFGNMIREQAEYFTLEDIAHLLKIARATFDVIVVETNAYWDNAGTLGALLEADGRYWVTTKELAHFQEDTNRWLHTLSQPFGLQASAFDLIVTQTDKQGGSGALRLKDIRRETGLQVIGQLHRHPEVSEYLDQGKLADLLLQTHPIARELKELAEPLIRFHRLERKPPSAPAPAKLRLKLQWKGLLAKGRAAKWEA